jgi:hypothetical protein
MTIADLDRIEEEARRTRIQAGFDDLREILRKRQSAPNPAVKVERHTHCVVCGKELPPALARVCSGACYQKAPLDA